MKTIDYSNAIAAEMERVLNSDENKELFSKSSVLEKLAFKKVSEEDKTTEVEEAFQKSLNKTASKCCECAEDKDSTCKCDCHEKHSTSAVINSLNSLLKVSEDLDAAGFDKLAATAILLADRLVIEAKAKAKAKSSKKSTEKSKTEKSKSKSKSDKKVDMKERMKKMREAKEKDSKKSSEKKVSKAENTVPKEVFDALQAKLSPELKAAIAWDRFDVKNDGADLFVTAQFAVKNTPAAQAAVQKTLAGVKQFNLNSLTSYFSALLKKDPRIKRTNIIENI